MMPFEKLLVKFWKSTLNVHKTCNSNSARFELGRYPLALKIWSSCVKYFIRLAKGTNNNILNSAFAESKSSEN